MSVPRRPGEFDYINRYYGLSLKKYCPVESKTRHGQVVKGDGNYIFIQWDGETGPSGPYHPTSDLTYPKG